MWAPTRAARMCSYCNYPLQHLCRQLMEGAKRTVADKVIKIMLCCRCPTLFGIFLHIFIIIIVWALTLTSTMVRGKSERWWCGWDLIAHLCLVLLFRLRMKIHTTCVLYMKGTLARKPIFAFCTEYLYRGPQVQDDSANIFIHRKEKKDGVLHNSTELCPFRCFRLYKTTTKPQKTHPGMRFSFWWSISGEEGCTVIESHTAMLMSGSEEDPM